MSRGAARSPVSADPMGCHGPLGQRRRFEYAGLLFSQKLVADRTKLLSEEHSAFDVRMDIEVIYSDQAAQLSLLRLEMPSVFPHITPCAMQVVRGRRGGKSSELLHIVLPLQESSIPGISAQRAGMAKAVVQFLAGLPSGMRGNVAISWLAFRLAADGYVSRSEYSRLVRRIGVELPDDPPGTRSIPGFLLSEEWMQRSVRGLVEDWTRLCAKNPMASRFDILHVKAKLTSLPASICSCLLFDVARALQREVRDGPLGTEIAPDLAKRTSPEVKTARAAREILDLYEAWEGLPVEALMRTFPSAIHVIAWLLESHSLIASPGGYLFTRAQLEAGYSEFKLLPGASNPPPTGDIKSKLGWKRRAAEEYRALLELGPVSIQLGDYSPTGAAIGTPRNGVRGTHRESKAARGRRGC